MGSHTKAIDKEAIIAETLAQVPREAIVDEAVEEAAEEAEVAIDEALEEYVPEEINYPEVVTHADLPDAAEFWNETFIVLSGTGIFGINRKRAGMWRSNGVAWHRIGDLTGSGGVIFGTPPVGKYQIYRLWRNADGELGYEFENTPRS